MILYQKHQNEFFIPLFLGFLAVLLNFAPITAYLNTKSTNTDSLTRVKITTKIEKLAVPEKSDLGEIDVPILGETKQAVSTPVETITETASTTICGNTPTPGVGQISICGRLISLGYSDNTTNVSPPGGSALKYTARNFIFGHNSADVFGGLHVLLQPGDPLMVNFAGTVETYHYNYYAQNQSRTLIDDIFLPSNGSNTIALMTCAPWVVDGLADSSRYGFIFTK